MVVEEFESAFLQFQPALKSYLLRILANREDADDLSHDTYVKALQSLETFAGKSTLKTWVFSIATNLARDHFRAKQRWVEAAQDNASGDAKKNPHLIDRLIEVNRQSAPDSFEIRDHIDFCFTCMGKTLSIEQQIALILKDIYEFKVGEIMVIMDLTEGKVKHALADARRTLIAIFENRCSLIHKRGACYQCSELNGIVNPLQDTQVELMKLKMIEEKEKGSDKSRLYDLRVELIKGIDPVSGGGNKLYAYFLRLMPDYSPKIGE